MGAIIGLSGKSGSGKDYVANAIIKDFPEYKFKKASFSYELKRAAAFILDLPIELFYTQEGKLTIIPWLGITIREFLQKLGTDAIRDNIDVDFWVKKIRSKIEENINLIFIDMRFVNEKQMIKDLHGLCARVNRTATISDWNKLSGLNTPDHNSGLISKEYYINRTKYLLYGSKEKKNKLSAMVHLSEKALDNEYFDWYYEMKTGDNPVHGRLSKYIFEKGYIPWDENEQ
ncbi:MAG: deoxynucleotide monophosphate kinase family protein [Candidatus Scalindua sp.]